MYIVNMYIHVHVNGCVCTLYLLKSIHTEHDVRVDDIIVSSLLVHPDKVHMYIITSAMLSILGRAGATLLVAYELHALYI